MTLIQKSPESQPASSLQMVWRAAFYAVLLIALGTGIRLFDLTDQPIDFHPTRQLRSAIIARGMYYEVLPNADPALREQAIAFWDSTGQYEPSILERATSLGYLVLGREIAWLGRLINIIFWLIGSAALFNLAKLMTGSDNGVSTSIGALSALAYYLILPFGVQASRAFQPDPGMTVWILLTAWSSYRWSVNPNWRMTVLTGIMAGMAILTKAIAFYTVAGMLGLIIVYTFGQRKDRFFAAIGRIVRSIKVWVISALAVLPTLFYYLSRSERASEYLNSWTLSLSHLLLQPATYLRWSKLLIELLTPFGLAFALIGVILAKGRAKFMLTGLWIGYLAYGLFLPYQMTTHSYYHLQLVPITALSIAPAAQRLADWLSDKSRLLKAVAVGLSIFILAFGSWQALIPLYTRDHRNEPAYWQQIANFLPKDGKIIALTQDYGYRLMYYGWRKVVLWPNRGEIRLSVMRGSGKEFQEFFVKRTAGKRYFLVTAFNQFNDQPVLKDLLFEKYPILAEGEGYLIFDLFGKKLDGMIEGAVSNKFECHPFR